MSSSMVASPRTTTPPLPLQHFPESHPLFAHIHVRTSSQRPRSYPPFINRLANKFDKYAGMYFRLAPSHEVETYRPPPHASPIPIHTHRPIPSITFSLLPFYHRTSLPSAPSGDSLNNYGSPPSHPPHLAGTINRMPRVRPDELEGLLELDSDVERGRKRANGKRDKKITSMSAIAEASADGDVGDREEVEVEVIEDLDEPENLAVAFQWVSHFTIVPRLRCYTGRAGSQSLRRRENAAACDCTGETFQEGEGRG
ncbi:hypothetical protein DFP72DRAFT_900091 [Ephemerocybe angulata]|uniref:Uncharacterized protein n=1 Tax=Ephemerocybe angulata TaxID=980116 RepID=A0A8H6M459_9AGAR|nr:hypothetical protein DFP72DRAFT_900091 [Tulosesus angulatus]